MYDTAMFKIENHSHRNALLIWDKFHLEGQKSSNYFVILRRNQGLSLYEHLFWAWFSHLFVSSIQIDGVERRPCLGCKDAVFDIVIDQLHVDKILEERSRLSLTPFQRIFKWLKIRLNDLEPII